MVATYIPYPRALALLKDRLNATPSEMAAWVFFSSIERGLVAYLNDNEFSDPPRFCFLPLGDDGSGYLNKLASAWFRLDDIESFEPTNRYITGAELRDRWRQWVEQSGISPDAYILAKIGESRLLDISPVSGDTQWSYPDTSWATSRENALFVLAHVEAIEEEDGITPHIQGTSKPRQARIVPYKNPERMKDDWTEVLIAAIEEHEAEHGHTGTETQIWLRMIKQPPKGYPYEWDASKQECRMLGNPPLPRGRFSDRFARLYPDVKPAKAR